MPLSGTITQVPDGTIPAYPAQGPKTTYPTDWADPAYDPVVRFDVIVEGVPDGWTVSYKWSIVALPQEDRYKLRRVEAEPPGDALPSEGYWLRSPQAWVPFGTRWELDNGRGRHDYTEYYVECVVKAETETTGDHELLTLRQTLEMDQTGLVVDGLPMDDRISTAIKYSAPYWPGAVADEAVEFFTDPVAIGFMVATTVGFIGLALLPEPWSKLVGLILGGALLAYFGYTTLEQTATCLVDLWDNCSRAQTNEDLRVAGQRFAEEGGEPVFNVLLFIVLWRVGRGVSKYANEIKAARLGLVDDTLATRVAEGAPAVNPEFLAEVETATHITRRMNFSEWIKLVTGVGKGIKPGGEQTKVFSLDEPYTFKKEALKDPGKYWIVHKILITDEMRALMQLCIDNNVKIPEALKGMPRYKFENGRWNLVVPRSMWLDFQVMYTVIDVLLVPIDPTDDASDVQDEETLKLETE